MTNNVIEYPPKSKSASSADLSDFARHHAGQYKERAKLFDYVISVKKRAEALDQQKGELSGMRDPSSKTLTGCICHFRLVKA
jgi:hypothetical protein